ncbi:DUF3106 domain-containing protein [Variovorax sp. NFACC26]|uniref:DUF3106 domain-containing protein n=1 Tax=Variovorax gossypii TaxID=1679495 RepID=A0A3S0IHD5_9BURK|nr:DUF3106 domain-containing protein [Variovorax gossypii]SEF27634.1 Protein of unknown function [Variovorax sp. NFACC28]SEG73290.1 Protein of unknown function [Variovorax sp. NFACC29]SFC76027.1 Protein of unknown function [Variovorax sp. NFACC26]SFG01825.1 Protein of unknown function [Variovorax sp. NFACC27]
MRRRSTSSANSPRPLRPLPAGAVVWAGAFAVAAFSLTLACAQPHGEAASKAAASSAPATSPKAVSTTKPLWSELTAEQEQALKPLSAHWNTLNVGQKRKWLALSRNFGSMSAEEQSTLHSRMIEWAALSNQQRAQARLNFAEVKRIPPDERKVKWEQYQALSEEEKRKLAERAPPKPRGAAIPVRPVSSQKLVPVPAVTPGGQHTPRILLAPPPAPTVTPATTIMVASPPERAPAAATATPAVSVVPAAPAPSGIAAPPVPAEAQVPAPSSAAESSSSSP